MYKNPYGGRISVLGIDEIYYIVYLKVVGTVLKMSLERSQNPDCERSYEP